MFPGLNFKKIYIPLFPIIAMAFLRVKKINGNLYCYLVQNKHTKKGPRQKVKKYLGKVVRLEQKQDDADIGELDGLFKKSKENILYDLIKFELIRHGFKEKKDFLINKDICFNKNNFKILRRGKDVLLSLNEGFLSDFTIKRILDFKKTHDFQKDAHSLAKYFVEAGFNIPKEIFIEFYQKC